MFEQIENDGLAIESELIALELKEQIVKAQIIYMSCFDEVEKSENKGIIQNIPEIIGLILISGDSIGIYIGNDEVIYAKSIEDGIVKENVSDGSWTDWFELPEFEYVVEDEENDVDD